MDKCFQSLSKITRSISHKIEYSIYTKQKKNKKVHLNHNKPLNEHLFIEKKLMEILNQDPKVKTLGFFNKTSLTTYLNQIEHECKNFAKLSFLLNSKLMPKMLQQRHFSIMNKFHLKEALKYTIPQNIFISNLFKDIQTLCLANQIGVKNMSVNCIQEVYKVMQHCDNPSYIWQFQAPGKLEAKVLFPLLKDFKIDLNGIKFHYDNSNQLLIMKQICQMAKKCGHPLKKIIIQIDMNQIHQIQKIKKALNQHNIIIELAKFQTTEMVYCAAKVIGCKPGHIFLYDQAQNMISPLQKEQLKRKNVKVGDWIVFEPTEILRFSNMIDIWTQISKQSLLNKAQKTQQIST